jgi:Type I phosphodiesterase / nucleotide pyrophosphatase
MSDVGRLLDAFKAGRLVRPGDGPTTVDLIRALYRRCGDAGLAANDHVREIEDALGPAEHYIFAVVDGLGTAIAERFSRGGFFTRARSRTLQSVFPSTTASAMTSFATAEYPAQHGVTGWWVYLPDHDLSATILPYVERIGGASLLEHGVELEDAFRVASRWPRLAHTPAMITPADISTGTYSDYLTGLGRRLPYSTPEEAFDLARRTVAEATGPTFTLLYLTAVDGRAHAYGVESPELARAVERYEGLFEKLAESLDGRARIVATADHGLIDVPDGAKHLLTPEDPAARELPVPPSGEPAVPVFHVKAGRTEAFAAAFCEQFGEHFALLTVNEVEELELYGPAPLAPTTRARLGDFVAIALAPGVLVFRSDTVTPHDFCGYHAGLSPAEMRVPLLIA